MRNLTVVVVLLLLVPAAPALARDHGDDFFVYDQYLNYEGPFKNTRVYTRNERNRIWFLSKRFQTTGDLSCSEVKTGLASGTWTGNLADNGECLPPGEAPEWTTGNYLNFLSAKSKFNRDNAPESNDRHSEDEESEE